MQVALNGMRIAPLQLNADDLMLRRKRAARR